MSRGLVKHTFERLFEKLPCFPHQVPAEVTEFLNNTPRGMDFPKNDFAKFWNTHDEAMTKLLDVDFTNVLQEAQWQSAYQKALEDPLTHEHTGCKIHVYPTNFLNTTSPVDVHMLMYNLGEPILVLPLTYERMMMHAIRMRLFGTDMRWIAAQYSLDHLRKWHYILSNQSFWYKDYKILYGCEIDAALQYADSYKLTVLPCGIERLDDFDDMVNLAGEAALHVDSEASLLCHSAMVHLGYNLSQYDILPMHMFKIVNMFHPLTPHYQELEKAINWQWDTEKNYYFSMALYYVYRVQRTCHMFPDSTLVFPMHYKCYDFFKMLLNQHVPLGVGWLYHIPEAKRFYDTFFNTTKINRDFSKAIESFDWDLVDPNLPVIEGDREYCDVIADTNRELWEMSLLTQARDDRTKKMLGSFRENVAEMLTENKKSDVPRVPYKERMHPRLLKPDMQRALPRNSASPELIKELSETKDVEDAKQIEEIKASEEAVEENEERRAV